jgi:hypothetical protein
LQKKYLSLKEENSRIFKQTLVTYALIKALDATPPEDLFTFLGRTRVRLVCAFRGAAIGGTIALTPYPAPPAHWGLSERPSDLTFPAIDTEGSYRRLPTSHS